MSFDTRGHQQHPKIRHDAASAARREMRTGFSERLTLSGKSAYLRFGVFQQNRPVADNRDRFLNDRFRDFRTNVAQNGKSGATDSITELVKHVCQESKCCVPQSNKPNCQKVGLAVCRLICAYYGSAVVWWRVAWKFTQPLRL